MGVTAKAVVVSLGDGVAASSFDKVKAYVQRVGEIAAYAQAASAIGAFTKVGAHETACRYHKAMAMYVLCFHRSVSQADACNSWIHIVCQQQVGRILSAGIVSPTPEMTNGPLSCFFSWPSAGNQRRRSEGWPAEIASYHVRFGHVQGVATGEEQRDNVVQRAEVPRLQERRLPVQCRNVSLQGPQGVWLDMA